MHNGGETGTIILALEKGYTRLVQSYKVITTQSARTPFRDYRIAGGEELIGVLHSGLSVPGIAESRASKQS